MKFFTKLLGLEDPPERARRLGRNALCWCGSHKKYKQCHHKTDQEYFSRTRQASCTSYG